MSWKRFKRLAHRHVPHCRKLHPYAGSTARMELCGVVSRTRFLERDAVPEMKEDPSEPACRSRFQTPVSCCCSMTVMGNVTEKA